MPTHLILLLLRLLTFLLLGSLHLGPAAAQETATKPPGLVPVDGVRAKIGADLKAIQKLIEENETLAKLLVSETPRHTVQVDDFLLQVNEVTNEQFAAYVADTRVRPPSHWGQAAIEKARAEWLAEEAQRKKEGKPRSTGKFDPEGWWSKNWKDSAWGLPLDLADHPVTNVDYADALGYAHWTGLRLMTEAEFQAAARGSSETDYPWGDAWDPKKAAGLDSGRVKTWPVGSFAPTNGLFDLIGNVWEWTSTPFSAYPGYKPIKVKTKSKREVEGLANFDRNQRVAVGGDFNQPAIALRVSVRRECDRTQRTSSLGFRCASSPKPGRDLAQYVTQEVVSPRAFPHTEFVVELPTILHRWTYEVPSPEGKGDAARTAGAIEGRAFRPEGYAVITGYDAMLFVPAKELPGVNVTTLDSATADTPVPIGILYTSVPVKGPPLEPGAYYLAYRGGAKLKELPEGEEPPAWRSAQGYDPLQASLFVLDGEGAPLLAFPAGPKGYDRITGAGSATFEPWVPPAKPDKDAPPPIPVDVVRFRVAVQGGQNNRGYTFELPLQVEPGTVDASWGSK